MSITFFTEILIINIGLSIKQLIVKDIKNSFLLRLIKDI